MANFQMGAINSNITNKEKAEGQTGNTGLTTPANYASIDAMRTRLAAINGTYYTAAMLDQMSTNDMVWAIRSADDPTTI